MGIRLIGIWIAFWVRPSLLFMIWDLGLVCCFRIGIFNWIAFGFSFYFYGACILFGLCLFLLFLHLGFSWRLDRCFGIVLRMWETLKQLGQVKTRYGLSWLTTRIFGLKRKKNEQKRQRGEGRLWGDFFESSLYFLWVFCEGWELGYFLASFWKLLKAMGLHF